MKRQSLEEYQRKRAAQLQPPTTRADEGRKNEIKERGLEALRFIHSNQTWERWQDIGEALLVVTEEAAAAVAAEGWDKDNKPLVKLFNRKWDQYEQRVTNDPGHRPLSKQERTMLRFVMEHPEVGSWRATQIGPKKRKLNHPNAVVNAWKRTQPRAPKQARQPSPALSPALATRDKEIADLKAHVAELEAARGVPELEAARGQAAAPKTLLGVLTDVVALAKDPANWPASFPPKQTANLAKALGKVRDAVVARALPLKPRRKKSVDVGYSAAFSKVTMERDD